MPARRRERASRWRKGGGSGSDRADEDEEILRDLDESVAPLEAPTGHDVEDELEGELEERETGEESERPRRRRRRRRRSSDRTATDSGPRKAAPEREGSPGRSVMRDSDVDDETDDVRTEREAGAEDEAEEDLAKKPSHRGIVSWEQAIGYIVKANMETRKNARNGRGGPERSRTAPRDRHGGRRK